MKSSEGLKYTLRDAKMRLKWRGRLKCGGKLQQSRHLPMQPLSHMQPSLSHQRSTMYYEMTVGVGTQGG